MSQGHGNQYISRKALLWGMIHAAHDFLIGGDVQAAQGWLAMYREHYAKAPASSRRRWRCGQ